MKSTASYARVQTLVGRSIAVLMAFVLLLYPFIPAENLPVPAALSERYAQLLRWAGLAWLALAFAPWARVAPAIAFWPGADPHNLYGGAAVVLGILAVMGLMGSILLVFGLLSILLVEPAWGLIVGGGFSGAFGVWAMRASRRMQELAVERDRSAG
jgi:hypothetical protein